MPAPTGWAFVIGDIDAGKLTIRATVDTGAIAADLGFRPLNLCDVAPRSSACGTSTLSAARWDPGTLTIDGNDVAADPTPAWSISRRLLGHGLRPRGRRCRAGPGCPRTAVLLAGAGVLLVVLGGAVLTVGVRRRR